MAKTIPTETIEEFKKKRKKYMRRDFDFDGSIRTVDKKYRFLLAYEATWGNVAKACREVNVARKTIYEWRKLDPEFKKALETVDEAIIDAVETQLFRRIIELQDFKAIAYFLDNKARHRGWGKYSVGNASVEKSKSGITIKIVEKTEEKK